MHSNTRGLAYLLSIGSLPIACFKDEMGGGVDSTTTEATGASTTGGVGPGSSGDSASSPTTGADATGSVGTTVVTTTHDEDTTTGVTSATTTTDAATTTDVTTTATTATTGADTGGPAPDEQCLAYTVHVIQCIPRYAQYFREIAAYCQYTKDYGLKLDGKACLAAIEAYVVCISNADCAELSMNDAPCLDAATAADTACPLLNEKLSGNTTG